MRKGCNCFINIKSRNMPYLHFHCWYFYILKDRTGRSDVCNLNYRGESRYILLGREAILLGKKFVREDSTSGGHYATS